MEKELFEIVAKISRIPVGGLTLESELFESRIISSLGLLEMMDEIERLFKIEIFPEELIKENFSTIGRMKEFISGKIKDSRK